MIKLWDLSHRSCLDTYLGHTEALTDMDIFSKGRPITTSLDKSARFWKTTLDSHLVFAKHTSSADAVCALDNETFVTGGQDGSMHVWGTGSGRKWEGRGGRRGLHGGVSSGGRGMAILVKI